MYIVVGNINSEKIDDQEKGIFFKDQKVIGLVLKEIEDYKDLQEYLETLPTGEYKVHNSYTKSETYKIEMVKKVERE